MGYPALRSPAPPTSTKCRESDHGDQVLHANFPANQARSVRRNLPIFLGQMMQGREQAVRDLARRELQHLGAGLAYTLAERLQHLPQHFGTGGNEITEVSVRNRG